MQTFQIIALYTLPTIGGVALAVSFYNSVRGKAESASQRIAKGTLLCTALLALIIIGTVSLEITGITIFVMGLISLVFGVFFRNRYDRSFGNKAVLPAGIVLLAVGFYLSPSLRSIIGI